MSKRGWLLSLTLLCALAARQPPPQCGTYAGRAQAEVFLHRRSAQSRVRGRAAAAQINQDIGNVAVLDDSGGVIDRRNPFDLDRRTLIFTPASSGYSVSLGGDTFDAAAGSAGAVVAGFGDDDTRSFALSFTFSFFGAVYRQIWVNSNGFLTFGGGDTDASGSYGHFISGLPAIAPLFTDLDPSQSSDGVHVLSEPGRLVVTFASVPLYNSSDFGIPQIENFQVRLYADGHIEIAYRSANPPDAVVGITPGSRPAGALVAFSSSPAGVFASGVAEIFSSSDAVDPVAAAQRFYESHDDAYDYLIFYNAENVAAGAGTVAYEATVRSGGQGYGDSNHDDGAEYGSPRRLQAVLNLGPLSQYPPNPSATVPARAVTGDTPLTILAHEAGHLYLALVSVPNPSDASGPPPMLGRALVHWAFTFNSEASFLEGNRIADAGAGVSPRFSTTATVQSYSALDQYLMGFLPPEQVPPTFAVLGSNQSPARAPQTGVSFNGNRLDIAINDIIQAAGRRTPDSTVAQRRFRFAFVLIVPPGTDLSAGGSAATQVAQVDRYRSEFEAFFANATGNRAGADTSLKRSVALSMFPGAGVVAGAGGTASLALASPATSPVTFALQTPNSLVAAPQQVTIPAGGTRASFQVAGVKAGVEEFSAIPSDASYETAFARVQVTDSLASLHVAVESGDKQTNSAPAPLPDPVVVRVADQNNLAYSNVTVTATTSAGGSVQPPAAVTGDSGAASFVWTPAPGSGDQLTLSIASLPASAVVVTALGRPAIAPNGIVNGASFGPSIAAGGFATIFGTSLAGGASASSGAPFPIALAGVQVLINGSPAPLVSVSDRQVNFLAPANVVPGSASLMVQTPFGTSDPVQMQVDAYAPGIFFDASTGYGAVLSQPGGYLEIYCTGLGPLNVQPSVQIAGLDAAVLYSGQTSIPGLYQVNVQVPSGAPSGTQSLSLTIGGVMSNTVKVQIAGN